TSWPSVPPTAQGHGMKNAVMKSKKSWESVTPLLLKSAFALKKAAMKSKKSWLVTTPSWFQSPAQPGLGTGASKETFEGVPGLKRPSVTEPVTGAVLASNQKLYMVPQRSALEL